MKRTLSILLAAAVMATPVLAKSSFSRSSSSYSNRGYSRPAPPARQNVTIKRTTIVQQSAPSGGAGGGMAGSFLGSMAGAGIGSWLFAPKPAAPPVPQPQVIDCSRQPLPAEWLGHCPKAQ